MLRKRMQTRTGESVTMELGLGDCKLALAQANCSGNGPCTAPGRHGDAEHEKISLD